MTKKLALVVHGIGEQKPGETLDALVGAITGKTDCVLHSEVRVLHDADNDHDPKVDNRKLKLFPCHIRRVDFRAEEGQEPDQVVFAEVFWGDISRGSSNRIAGLIELFQLVMGLGHLVRENAYAMFPDNNKHPMRRLAQFFVYLLHGPITVLNLAMGLAVLCFLGSGYFLNGTTVEKWVPAMGVLLAAGVMLLIYLAGHKKTQSHLFQIFWRWVLGIAGFLIVLMLITQVYLVSAPAAVQKLLADYVILADCNENLINNCLAAWYTSTLLFLVNVSWVLCILCAFTLWIGKFFLSTEHRKTALQGGDNKTLFPMLCGAMLILWLFMGAVLWATISWLLNLSLGSVVTLNDELALLNDSLAQGIGLILWIWAAFAVFVGSVVAVWFKRVGWNKGNSIQHTKNPLCRVLSFMNGYATAWVLVCLSCSLAPIGQRLSYMDCRYRKVLKSLLLGKL